MNDELVVRLRTCADLHGECALCLYQGNDCDAMPETPLVQAADAIENLQRLVEANKTSRWIPVTERLPETGVDVLVMFPHNMAVASRDMGEWVVNSGDGWCTDVNLSDDEKEPTHWMPLPEPPKEDPYAES